MFIRCASNRYDGNRINRIEGYKSRAGHHTPISATSEVRMHAARYRQW